MTNHRTRGYRVRHHISVNDLIQISQAVEKMTFSKAISYHLDKNFLVFRNMTLIFY